jgi:integrase
MGRRVAAGRRLFMPRHSSGAIIKRKIKKTGSKKAGTTKAGSKKRGSEYQLYARVSYIGRDGKRKRKEKKANNRSHAHQLIKQMHRELEDHGFQLIENEQMTFSALADYYKETYLVEPQYVEGRKVAGLRGYHDQKLLLNTLRGHFGRRKVRAITYGELECFRASRLVAPIAFKNKKGVVTLQRQRSIASVNRELALLRRIFNVALREGWIIRNPFNQGDSLISLADEKKRERILTTGEEDRLIAACTGIRSHIRPIIVMALDTGMRLGELLKLKWDDVDFEGKLVHVRAFNTKTMKERWLAMTSRVNRDLSVLYERSPKNLDDLVFGIRDNVKKAFMSARKAAGLNDLRFHDLRHTAATRLVQGHIPLSEVGRVLGHTQANTTYRYVNANVDTARRAAAVLDMLHNGTSEEDVTVIN